MPNEIKNMRTDILTDAVTQTLAKIAVVCLACAFIALAQHKQDQLKHNAQRLMQKQGSEQVTDNR
jgi:hypothetical protein